MDLLHNKEIDMAHLIDKDALVAEIKKQQRRLCILGQSNEVELRKNVAIQNGVYCSLLSFLDTFEAKDVNLEKEIKNIYLKYRQYGGNNNILVILNELQFNDIAKHFFELGMQVSNKAYKGE